MATTRSRAGARRARRQPSSNATSRAPSASSVELRRTRRELAKEKPVTPTVVDSEEAEEQAEEEETLFRTEATGSEPERWQDVLLARLHRLAPDAFEKFALYLLRLYGLELERVGGSGDEGIDGIGTAPLSPVLSSRVAVQVKRYDPLGKPAGRETVALFQRDAQTKGAERAILVTLGKFSEPARKAAIVTSPTVDLTTAIDWPRWSRSRALASRRSRGSIPIGSTGSADRSGVSVAVQETVSDSLGRGPTTECGTILG